MGIQQIPDQIKKAPTQGLRAVFSGIGRMLMSADRPQAAGAIQPRPGTERRRGTAKRSGRAVPVAEGRWRSLDQTGNVRLLSADELDEDFRSEPGDREPAASGPAASQWADREQAASERADSKPAASDADHREPAISERADHTPPPALPLPGYDSLSVASIRARLRVLDVTQLRILLEYESRNTERAEVLGMFERRIEKLETGR